MPLGSVMLGGPAFWPSNVVFWPFWGVNRHDWCLQIRVTVMPLARSSLLGASKGHAQALRRSNRGQFNAIAVAKAAQGQNSCDSHWQVHWDQSCWGAQLFGLLMSFFGLFEGSIDTTDASKFVWLSCCWQDDLSGLESRKRDGNSSFDGISIAVRSRL